MTDVQRYFIAGGAGFIGSHFTDRLLRDSSVVAVTIYDNFSSGREWHYQQHLSDSRFRVVRGDVKDLELLTRSMRGHDVVIHLASNPDIARAVAEPEVDARVLRPERRHVLVFRSHASVDGQFACDGPTILRPKAPVIRGDRAGRVRPGDRVKAVLPANRSAVECRPRVVPIERDRRLLAS